MQKFKYWILKGWTDGFKTSELGCILILISKLITLQFAVDYAQTRHPSTILVNTQGKVVPYNVTAARLLVSDGSWPRENEEGITESTILLPYFFSCDQAALWMVFSVRLSVCPSVRLSVCPSVRLSVRLSHLFDYVPIIVSSWNFQELSHWTRVRSMQKIKVRGQRSRSQRSRPNFSFPDCNSSLNSHMMMKWYI